MKSRNVSLGVQKRLVCHLKMINFLLIAATMLAAWEQRNHYTTSATYGGTKNTPTMLEKLDLLREFLQAHQRAI